VLPFLRALAAVGLLMVALDPLKALLEWSVEAPEAAVLVSFGTLLLFVLALLDPSPL
jgi:hypothetical protein